MSAIHAAVIARLDRAIQYAAALRFTAWPLEYWVPAFAGTTAAIPDCDRRPCAAEMISHAQDQQD